MELDADIGEVVDEIRKDAPNTIVIVTADNGAWLDAFPGRRHDAVPRRERLAVRRRLARSRDHVVARPYPGAREYDEMMSHIDAWATLAAMAGITPPPHEWVGNDGKPIYFDSIDNSAYILGKDQHSARRSWIYIDGETFWARAPTSAAIPRSHGSTSPGSISTPPGIAGWA